MTGWFVIWAGGVMIMIRESEDGLAEETQHKYQIWASMDWFWTRFPALCMHHIWHTHCLLIMTCFIIGLHLTSKYIFCLHLCWGVSALHLIGIVSESKCVFSTVVSFHDEFELSLYVVFSLFSFVNYSALLLFLFTAWRLQQGFPKWVATASWDAFKERLRVPQDSYSHI